MEYKKKYLKYKLKYLQAKQKFKGGMRGLSLADFKVINEEEQKKNRERARKILQAAFTAHTTRKQQKNKERAEKFLQAAFKAHITRKNINNKKAKEEGQIPISVVDAKTQEIKEIYVDKYEDTIFASIANAFQRELTDIQSIHLGGYSVGYDEDDNETTFEQEGIEESAMLFVEFKELDEINNPYMEINLDIRSVNIPDWGDFPEDGFNEQQYIGFGFHPPDDARYRPLEDLGDMEMGPYGPIFAEEEVEAVEQPENDPAAAQAAAQALLVNTSPTDELQTHRVNKYMDVYEEIQGIISSQYESFIVGIINVDNNNNIVPRAPASGYRVYTIKYPDPGDKFNFINRGIQPGHTLTVVIEQSFRYRSLDKKKK